MPLLQTGQTDGDDIEGCAPHRHISLSPLYTVHYYVPTRLTQVCLRYSMSALWRFSHNSCFKASLAPLHPLPNPTSHAHQTICMGVVHTTQAHEQYEYIMSHYCVQAVNMSLKTTLGAQYNECTDFNTALLITVA